MAADLASITAETQALLVDSGSVFDDDTCEQAILLALRELNTVDHYDRIGTITLASDSREINLSSLEQPCAIDRIWLPYTAASPEDPPNWRTQIEQWPETLLYVGDGSAPAAADVARIFYHTPHTIDDLESATATTLTGAQIGALVYGAAANALSARCRTIAESVTANKFALKNLEALHDRYRAEFDKYLATRRHRSTGNFVSW